MVSEVSTTGVAPRGSRHGAGPDPGIRERILRAAHDRFLVHGFSQITMEELARDLGMSKKTVYQHFATKTGLLDAVLELRMALVRGEVESVMADRTRSFAERLRAMLEVVSARLNEAKPPFLRDLGRHAPASFARVEAFRQEYLGRLFGQLLAEGRRLGVVRKDLDDRLVIDAVLVLVRELVNPDRMLALKIAPGAALETVLRLILQGVLVAPERRTR